MNNQKEIVEQIRNQYVSKETTKLDQLRCLDRKVKRPAEIFAYTTGCIGSLILGTGMSLAMEEIGNSIPLGVVIGCIGILIISANYFIYTKLLGARKRKYSKEIIEVSDELINAN